MYKVLSTVTAVAALFASQCAFAQATPATPATPASPAVAKQPDDPKFKPGVVKPEDKLRPQQDRMRQCNAQAAEDKLGGDERKAFMSDCLKGKDQPRKPPLKPQQQRMKDCNATAGEKQLKGPERKAFMSDCLRNK